MKSLKQVCVCVLVVFKNPSYLCNLCRLLTELIPSCVYMQLGPADKTSGKQKQTEGGKSIIHTFTVFLHLTTLCLAVSQQKATRHSCSCLTAIEYIVEKIFKYFTKDKITAHFHQASTVFTSMQILVEAQDKFLSCKSILIFWNNTDFSWGSSANIVSKEMKKSFK